LRFDPTKKGKKDLELAHKLLTKKNVETEVSEAEMILKEGCFIYFFKIKIVLILF